VLDHSQQFGCACCQNRLMADASQGRSFTTILREQMRERRARQHPPLSPKQRADRSAREQADRIAPHDAERDKGTTT
jgi:hypothetical protein